MLRKKLTERSEGDDDDKHNKPAANGTSIYFHDSWIDTTREPDGTAWIKYGFDYYRYKTSDSSPTIG
jgi:hypothetical protein